MRQDLFPPRAGNAEGLAQRSGITVNLDFPPDLERFGEGD